MPCLYVSTGIYGSMKCVKKFSNSKVFFQSIAFHDNGKKHQEMVELKLKSIRNKGKLEERQAKRADSWVKIMEEKAMKVKKKSFLVSFRRKGFTVGH